MEIERMSSVEKNIGEGEDEDVALPGFRFHPTDEELVGFYLRRKVEKKRLSIDFINQIDIYKFDPWDLAKQSTVSVGENKWYFFCLRGRKYRNSVRPNRVTRSGYWKATGIDKKIIFPPGTNNCIGLKKSLVYYCGKGGKGTKTYWMMHEFRLPPKGNELSDNPKTINADAAHEVENWTICRIFQRDPSSPKKSPSQSIPIPADDAKSTSWVVDSGDSAEQILEELFATSVSPRGEDVQVEQEQVLNHCADEQKCSSSSVFDELLSENQDSTIVLPDAFDDFGDTTWEELAKFL